MFKRLSDEEKSIIKIMIEEKCTNIEIAKRLNRSEKTIRNYLKGRGLRKEVEYVKQNRMIKKVIREASKPLAEMTKEARIERIEHEMNTSPRFVIVKKIFDKEFCELFFDEYLRLVATIDDITEAEEQMLFEACKAYTLSYVALYRAQEARNKMEKIISGEITLDQVGGISPSITNEKQMKEYAERQEEYRKYLQDLKVTRDKRIEQFKKDEESFADLVMKFTNEEARTNIANEIAEMEKKSDEELVRLLNGKWLIGDFSNNE